MTRRGAACVALLFLCSGCGGSALPKAKVAEVSAPDPLPPRAACYRLLPSQSELEVGVSTLVGDYTLGFARYRGEVRAVPSDPTQSRLWLQLDMRSLGGPDALVARAARSHAFLDAARFPRACFVTEHVTRDPGKPQSYVVLGALTLHGVSRGIELPVRVAESGSRYVVFSHFSLDRRLFDIRAPGVLDGMVDDEVAVRLQLVAEDCPGGGTVSRWWRSCAAGAKAAHSAPEEKQ